MSRLTVGLSVFAALFLSACGAAEAASVGAGQPAASEVSGDSGVEGVVLTGPSQPQSPISGSPNGTPTTAMIQVRSDTQADKSVTSQPGVLVARISSDTDGRFRITLPPGRYQLTPESPSAQLRAIASFVTVLPHAFTTVVLQLDNGLR